MRTVQKQPLARRLAAQFRWALLALLIARCGDQPAPPAALQPSPTIAAAALQPRPAFTPSPAPAGLVSLPPSTSPAPAGAQSPSPVQAEPFVYLWPAYLPEGMQISPKESRVAQEGQIGAEGLGFFIVTFKAGARKLVVGGGGLADALPLTGESQNMTIGSQQAILTTNGEQRQLVFAVPRGTLFVYGAGLTEQELLRVAESLAPIDVRLVREQIGEK